MEKEMENGTYDDGNNLENEYNSEDNEKTSAPEVVATESEEVDENTGIENSDSNTAKDERLTRLPIGRVKNIMKFDDDVHAASQEATFLITKATELFLENFMKEVYQCTLASKKKTVSKRDVDAAVFAQDYFIFLDGALE